MTNVTGRYELVTAVSDTSVTLAETRAHLRIDSQDDTAYLQALVAAADRWVETYTGRSLNTQTWRAWFDAAPSADGAFLLDRSPIGSITSVTSYDPSDASTVLSSSAYQLDAISEPARLVLKSGSSWPSNLRAVNSIAVQFVAGGATVAAPIKTAVLQIVAHWYENREPVPQAGSAAPLPFMAYQLLAPYRLHSGVL